MTPTRTKKVGPASASTSKLDDQTDPTGKQKRYNKPQHRRKHKDATSSHTALPGVQKIKSALRQTQRLLAKDNLAADVRTKSERRLKALETDLVQAERARKERALAQRYHAVKFFERQKITRRIQQVKRQFAQGSDSEEGKLRKKERKQLQKKLEELRVDLNYIIHYPKLQKYISLFTPELRSQPQTHPDPYPHTYSTTGEEPTDDTDAQREEVRAWVREQMSTGEMSAEPETELREKAEAQRQGQTSVPPYEKNGKMTTVSKKVPVSIGTDPVGLGGDDFFVDDDEEDGRDA